MRWLAILQDLDQGTGWWRMLLALGTLVASAVAYQRYQPRRSSILDDPGVTRGLSAEQRLRLELGLLETGPVAEGNPVRAAVIDNGREINAAVQQAIEASRLRERGHLSKLKPAELAALRRRMDAVLRLRWQELADGIEALAGDPTAARWGEALAEQGGVLAKLAELDGELAAARRQPTYPPIALQLEGPVNTLLEVLRHARESIEPDADHATAHSLRQSVIEFIEEQLPGIRQNIDGTAPDDEHREPDPAVQRELLLGGKVISKDLPSL